MNSLKHEKDEFKIITVYGGVPMFNQIEALKNGVDIFVGTTGRVLDHINRGNIDFSCLSAIILDEADVMLKLGFREDIEDIFALIKRTNSNEVQKCLFSATIPDWLNEIAELHMRKDRVFVNLAQDLKNKTAKNVNHIAIDCSNKNRIEALSDILSVYGKTAEKKTLVFC